LTTRIPRWPSTELQQHRRCMMACDAVLPSTGTKQDHSRWRDDCGRMKRLAGRLTLYPDAGQLAVCPCDAYPLFHLPYLITHILHCCPAGVPNPAEKSRLANNPRRDRRLAPSTLNHMFTITDRALGLNQYFACQQL
jgi:hypothetical protein